MTAINSPLEQARPPHPSLHHRRAPVVAFLSLVAALALAAAARWVASPAATTPPVQTPISLSERVLVPGAIHGFASPQQPAITHDPTNWALAAEHSRTSAREGARLHLLGFVAGISENLYATQRPSEGTVTSTAEQFRSPAQAQAELSYQYRRAVSEARRDGETVAPYAYSGIPGARGWTTRFGRSTAVSVLFAQGSFYYSLTTIAPANRSGLLTQREMGSALQSINLMINGCVSR